MTPKQPTQKIESSTTARAIDITQPGSVPASPTARPVITGHQPAVDPMVVADGAQPIAAVDTPHPAPAKIIIKPLTPEPDAVAIASSVDGIPVPPKRASSSADTDADGMVGTTLTEAAPQAGTTPAFIGPLTPAAPTITTATTVAPMTVTASNATQAAAPAAAPQQPVAVADAPADTAPHSAAGKEDTADLPGIAKIDPDKAAADMEAEAKAQDELDSLVEEKSYFLPINAASQRRSRNVFIFGTVLIIILLLAWLNIALDAGFVTIPGIGPVTHFFKQG